MNTIFPDNDARFFHMLEANTYLDYIQGMETDRYHFIQSEDESNSRLGLAWLVREPRENGDTIVGIEQCVNFLNTLPPYIWNRIKKRLKEIGFCSLAEKVLDNIIALEIDQNHWKKTSRANLALCNNKQDIIQVAWKRESRRNSASLASRLLVEMGICTSYHAGGRTISQSDFDALLADVILIVNIGQYSDAIKNGYMADNVKIMPSGNIHIPTAFLEEVVVPRSEHYFAEQFKQSAIYYEDYFYQKKYTEKTCEDVFGSQFTEAITAEFGFNMNNIKRFLASIEEYGLKLNKPYFQIAYNDLIELVSSNQNIDKSQVNLIVKAFSLPIRPSWNENIEAYKGKDWWPWKFRRKLSLISKPIITIKEATSISLLIAPSLVAQGIRYIIDGAYQGSFANDFFDSKELKVWKGKVNNERGHEFNNEVSKRLQQLGLSTETEATIEKITRRQQAQDLGDIDVLAWDTKKDKIYIFECKNLHFAKTVGEIVEQLNRFKGIIDKNGKPDELAKHLRRVNWAKNNATLLANYTGLNPRKSSIENYVVFSNTVPMKYFNNLYLKKERFVEVSQLHLVLK